jgi:hypothetical protein
MALQALETVVVGDHDIDEARTESDDVLIDG